METGGRDRAGGDCSNSNAARTIATNQRPSGGHQRVDTASLTMDAWCIDGQVATGLGNGAHFTNLPWARQQFLECLGIKPHPGTLNIVVSGPAIESWRSIRSAALLRLQPPDSSACAAAVIPITIAGTVTGAIVAPEVPDYPPTQIEVISSVPLRSHLGLSDGDRVALVGKNPRGIRAAVFDVDGTLVNSIDGMWTAASRAASEHGLKVPRDAVRRALNFGVSLWELIVPSHLQGDRELPARLRNTTMAHWPQVLAESVTVFDQLDMTLRRLRESGVALAIYTGSRGESFLPLERAGLLQLFHPVVTAQDVLRPKPHPEGLLRCLSILRCTAAEAAYIGDTRHDIQAARQAGMFAVGMLTGAADSAILSAAGADRILLAHDRLVELLADPPLGVASGPSATR